MPHAILEAKLVLWHVASQRLGINGKIYAGSLEKYRKKNIRKNVDTIGF